MFLKRKKSFFYLPNKKKYFDFSINFSSEVFNYNNPFINRKAKNNLNKRNFFLSKKQLDALSIKKLVNLFPFLEEYQFFLVEQRELTDFFIKKNFNLYIDPLERLNEKDFITIEKNNHPSLGGPPFNVVSDLFLNFKKSCDFLTDKTNQRNILYVNSTFPDLSILKKENIFSTIIVGGNHPWGANHLKLIMIRNDHHELQKHFRYSSSNCLGDYYLYSSGIDYYKKKINENNFKKNKAIINKRIFELTNHKQVSSIKAGQSENSFLYKIVLKEKSHLASLHQTDFFPRIFTKGLSFYFLENTIYIHLPINIPKNHLLNKFKKLAQII